MRTTTTLTVTAAGSNINSAAITPAQASRVGFAIQNNSDGNVTAVLQGSMDGTNWVSTGLTTGAVATTAAGFGANSGVAETPILFRKYRVALTTAATGPVLIDVSFFVR